MSALSKAVCDNTPDTHCNRRLGKQPQWQTERYHLRNSKCFTNQISKIDKTRFQFSFTSITTLGLTSVGIEEMVTEMGFN